MLAYASKQQQGITSKAQTWVHLFQVSLRTSAVGTTLAASCVTFTCKQTADVYGVEMDAKYSYSSAFNVFAYVTAIASVFSLLSLILTLILRWKGTLLLNKGGYRFLFFLHDLVMLLVLLGACAGATAIGYVGKYGNDHAGWVPICDNFHNFCHKITIAIILGYLGVICYVTIFVISNSKLNHDQTTTAAQVQDI